MSWKVLGIFFCIARPEKSLKTDLVLESFGIRHKRSFKVLKIVNNPCCVKNGAVIWRTISSIVNLTITY